MPLSSSQIAAINNQYTSGYMGQMQHASMIGGSLPISDSIVGGGINRAAAVGGPMAMGGLALMGLDPVSIGLRAGMGASGMGAGFMGAGAVGLGAAGLAGAGLMGVGYMGNQFVSGAQQQQAFNSSMNSTYRFANNYGGTGFGRGGLGDISSMMRQMTTEQGPNGQMVGFEELGRLASSMGRMGMAQGVRDAKDFSDKFREMIKTVKEIAQSMGTSLEEAQRMMGEMRGAGVFGSRQASAFAGKIRAGAVAGGMATSELTGMMQVGSQISRMVGGRGRAGAAGGIETLTNIGVAQQMGIMSEEDVYNVTGLTGAEGRRAMATRQMEQSAQFLRGSLGRRFLASVAGKNGKLDEGSIEEYLAGGVGTGRTESMYNRNLNKVGRADFIRNEGKLRGAALERLGGLAPMVAMKGWLEDRGVNVNEDADRAMIFMQRQLGMGNDESEMMLRQVRELPQIMRQRQTSAQDDSYMQRIAEKKSHSGIEGIKRKFESARAEVQSILQGAGASFYESMSESVEGFVNRLTDSYVKETRKDVAGAFRSAMGGGALGTEAARTTFGIGGGNLGSLFGGGTQFGKGPSDLAAFQKSDAARFAGAGFAFKGGDLTSHIGTVSQISNAFRGGDAGLSGRADIQGLGKSASGALQNALLNRSVTGRGMDRLESFGAFLKSQSGSGNTGLGALAQRYASAGALEKAQIMAAFTGEGGAGFDQSSSFLDPGLKGIFGSSGFATVGEGDEAVGRAFLGAGSAKAERPSALSLMSGGMFGSLGGGLPSVSSYAGGNAAGVGRFLRSDSARESINRIFLGSAGARDESFRKVSEEIMQLQDKEKLSGEERSRLQGLKGIVFARRLNDLKNSGASPDQLSAEAEKLAKEYGVSADQVRAQTDTILGLAAHSSQEARAQAAERFGEEARGNLRALERGGLVTGSGDSMSLNAAAVNKIAGKNGSASRAFLGAMLEKQKALAAMGPGKSPEETRALLEKGINAGQSMGALMSGMSVSEQRQLASNLQGIEGTEEVRGELSRNAAIGGLLEKGFKRGGKAGGVEAAAGLLGANLGKDELARALKEGGPAAVAKLIASKMGGGIDKDSAAMGSLTTSIESISSGKAGAGAHGLDQFMGNETVRKARVAAAESGDPNKNLEKLRDNSDNMLKALTSAVTILGDIKTNTGSGDAEEK